MSFYSELADTAQELLTEFGADATLVIRTPTYNPATDLGSVTTTNVAVKTVVIDYPRKFDLPTTILFGDKLAIMSAASGGEPRPGDQLNWDSRLHSIISVTKLAPAGTPILYELQVRA